MGKRKQLAPADAIPLFFKKMYGSDPGGYVEVRAFPNKRGPAVGQEFVTDAVTFGDAVGAYDNHDGDCGVFFGVAVRSRESGLKRDVSHSFVVWAEVDTQKSGWDTLDVANACHALPAPLQPSCCVLSGHGVHLYWYLDEAVSDIGTLEGVNKLLRDTFSGDNVWNADRVMRVPWTWNTKSKPVQSRVLWNYHWRADSLQSIHDAAAEFDSVLNGVGFIPRSQWEAEDVARYVRNTDPAFAYRVSSEDRRLRTNARGLKIWQQCRYGGGPGCVSLDEAIMLYTAHEYCRLSSPTPEKIDSIVTETMRFIRKIKEEDAPNERWDWKAEELEVRDKLLRWARKWDGLKSDERKVEKEKHTGKRRRQSART